MPADPTAPITRGDAANIFYGVLAWYEYEGLIQDTSVRTDSLIYQYKYDNKKMSPEDKLILTLLYHEDILPQMGYDECAAIIKTIYK